MGRRYRKNRVLPILEEVEITGFAAEGKSLARVEEKVVFVHVSYLPVLGNRRNCHQQILHSPHNL